jgi:hypothetical protein
MTTRLVQKHLLKGTQELEIVDDTVNVRIQPRFGREETLTVMLAVLNSEPVISRSMLEFTSRVNSEPLLSLFLAKPNPQEFNAFVNLLKQKIQDEFSAFAGLKPGMPSGMEANVFDEAPTFDDTDSSQKPKKKRQLRAEDIEGAIGMLKAQLGSDDIAAFLAALETLRADPMNDAHLARVMDEFRMLGPRQGAVLSYAPYMIAILSDDPYENL